MGGFAMMLGVTFGAPLAVGLLVLCALVIGAMVVLSRALDRRGDRDGEKDPAGEALAYRARGSVFDHDSEKRFFGVLERALARVYGPGARRVLVQVPLCRVVEVDRAAVRGQKGAWQRCQNRIDRKTVDYVVCDGAILETLFAVELDGSSHELRGRPERDEFVERVLERAGVRLVRFDRRGRDLGVEEAAKRIAKEGTAAGNAPLAVPPAAERR
jgi:very-short-patch-repair endonuclease